MGDIEVFARHARAPVVAVTGTNGKSTVTSLLKEMAQAAGLAVRAGGNLGPPALDLLRADSTARFSSSVSGILNAGSGSTPQSFASFFFMMFRPEGR